jgi:exopolyphosphatase/guanosine-5'-triphosphate,3'-diphosphate pyrophosphatase
MTERFLPDEHATKKQIKALRSHVADALTDAAQVPEGGRLVGLGGTIRNLAAAALRAADLPDRGVQGFVLTSEALEELIEELASRRASERGHVNGIKPERGDVILAGALTVATVMEAVGVSELEVSQAGLREGVFFETLLADSDPPLFENVRKASVLNLAHQYHWDPEHTEHVATLALQMFDTLATAGLHAGDLEERELLWAAAMLHDVGVAVDYDDHHKHSRYLILNGGLPGFTPREVALIALMARYHRKGDPTIGEDEPLMREGDGELLDRCAALLRLAEHLDRGRDQQVYATQLATEDGVVRLDLLADGDPTLARWSAERERELFEHAFGRTLVVS